MASQLSRNRPAGTVRVAVAQTAPELGANERNLNEVVEWLGEAAAQGARLVVFPECALSGYLLDDLDELERCAEPVPGPAIRRLAEACARRQVYTVVGLLERGADAIYNAAVLVGPEGLIALYREAHLPGSGSIVSSRMGTLPFAVHETPVGRIGMAICYDIRFPEPTRLLALHGADIVTFPSNWPLGRAGGAALDDPGGPDPCPRHREPRLPGGGRSGGEERGSRFLGRSQLIDLFGTVVAEAGSEEALLYADFDLALARQKDFVTPRSLRDALVRGPSHRPLRIARRSKSVAADASSHARGGPDRPALAVVAMKVVTRGNPVRLSVARAHRRSEITRMNLHKNARLTPRVDSSWCTDDRGRLDGSVWWPARPDCRSARVTVAGALSAAGRRRWPTAARRRTAAPHEAPTG